MRLKTIPIILLFFMVPVYLFSDQTSIERILKENKSFIEFMNLCVSNFGKEKVKKHNEKFLDIYQDHFNAQVFFLQSDYKNAYLYIRNSQKKQVALFQYVLRDVYLEDTKDILDRLAPEIIKSKSSRARLYLTLAYRDRSVSKNFETIGNATHPKLFSYKLHKYVEGIKLARRAKRYGFLSLYESRGNDVKRDIFNHLMEMERESGKKFYNRFLKKHGKSFMDEIEKSYDVHEKEAEKSERGKPGTDNKDKKTDKGVTFEKKVEKRVRFRNEKILAKYLLHYEFDRAEEKIREYIVNFNFKLIIAVIEVLAARKKEGADGIDYKSYIIHHYDNYSKYAKDKKSLLDEISKKVKVIDDIKKDDESTGKEGKKADNDKKSNKDEKK